MLLAGLWLCPRARAVDPLPPEIQRAPLSVQAEFLQRRGEESDRLKKQVGIERYERREAERIATVTAVAEQADERRREVYQQAVAAGVAGEQAAEDPNDDGSHPVRNFVLLMGGAALLYRFRSKILPATDD